jgi:uncharacterized protein YmfQ (DUF2313 family)
MTETEFGNSIRQTWASLFPKVPVPDDGQWTLWLLLHDPATVTQGIAQLAAKYRKVGGMDIDYMTKFASSVMNRITRERN